MRIRILDPHWKKWIRIQVISLKFTEFFLSKNNFQIYFLFFFAYFYPKTRWTIQKWGSFYNLFFSKVNILVLEVKKIFAVFVWYFTPWIQIRGSAYFCGSGSRKPKSCTDLKDTVNSKISIYNYFLLIEFSLEHLTILLYTNIFSCL